jgi:coenzyme F420-dependent glucose-6-phosphate dehydrogenase
MIGTAVTPAVKRYHPALVAQAFATLEELFPGRVFLGVGSGESLNESPVGCDWPDGKTQLELMEEALEVIRRLWSGETLDGGRHFRMKAARLYTRPKAPPPLYVSAFHNRAARAAVRYGDGLWCLGVSDDEFKTKAIISADPDEHVERLRQVIALGATTLAVMNCSGADPEGAIRIYRERVLPRLDS